MRVRAWGWGVLGLLGGCPFGVSLPGDVAVSDTFGGDVLGAEGDLVALHPARDEALTPGDAMVVAAPYPLDGADLRVFQDGGDEHRVPWEVASGTVLRGVAPDGLTAGTWFAQLAWALPPEEGGGDVVSVWRFDVVDPPPPGGPWADGAWWVGGADLTDPDARLLVRLLDRLGGGGRALWVGSEGGSLSIGTVARAPGLPLDGEPGLLSEVADDGSSRTAGGEVHGSGPEGSIVLTDMATGWTTSAGGGLARGWLRGTVDLRGLGDGVAAACDLAVTWGRSCQPCPAGGETACLPLAAVNLSATVWAP